MVYKAFGPFDLPRRRVPAGHQTLDFTADAIRGFWGEVNEAVQGLSAARGCYVFARRAGQGIRPWYVGRTTATFAKECFQPHKQTRYLEAYNMKKSGTPIIFFLPRCTKKGGFTNGKLDQKEIEFVEKMLIGLALRENSELMNKKDTKFLRELCVMGVVNNPVGSATLASQDLRKALGV